MTQVLTLRPLTDDETQQLKAGLRSHGAFTLRRCQILLAAIQGETTGRIARLVGCNRATVNHVINDFRSRGVACVREEQRRPGALPRGCPRVEERQPGIIDALEQLIADETAGDPMCEKKWVRVTQARLSQQLKDKGYQATDKTVARLLKDMGFSLKVNRRRQIKSRCPERDEQFRYIALQKHTFLAGGLPVISVDTKKKELIGPFRNSGRVWCREAEEVDEHDFPSAAECRAVPFGVYDLGRNAGYIVVGVSNNTPKFAVNVISRWWQEVGQLSYPGIRQLLILADCGGANGCSSRAWKLNLQQELCDRLGLTVTVCHYPTGCSKWNPIERRLFSQISTNWAGKPLKSLGIMLGYIRGTTTKAGLTVKAYLDEATYPKGQKVSKEEMNRLDLRRHDVCPKWNYTLNPRN
ncbi:MAG TPA: ISAzo13 family transposase [Gemmataceae bacterium]|nr:ISAzo13 family transposase [Gemmataceae bacterium]